MNNSRVFVAYFLAAFFTLSVSAFAQGTIGVNITQSGSGTPATVTLSATTIGFSDSIDKVEYFSNGVKVGESTTAPYTVQWQNVAAGSYNINALATVTTSAQAAPFTVAASGSSSVYKAPAKVTIAVPHTPSDSVVRADFYNQGTLIGTSTMEPFSFVWQNVAAGTYTVSAYVQETVLSSTVQAVVTETTVDVPPPVQDPIPDNPSEGVGTNPIDSPVDTGNNNNNTNTNTTIDTTTNTGGGGGGTTTTINTRTNNTTTTSSNNAVTVQAPIVTPPASVPPVKDNPIVSIAKGVWSFVPLVPKKTIPAAPSIIQPAEPSKPSAQTIKTSAKKSYTVVSAEYKLNGVLVHTASVYPDGWKIDTTTLKDGSYTLVSIFHIADGTSETNTSTFTVENTPTFASKVSAFISNTVSFFKGLFKKK